MTEAQANTLLQLVAAQVQLLAAISTRLSEMQASLASVAVDQEPAFATCEHPEEARVDLSTPGDRNHWICGACRFDNKATA